MNSTSSLNLQNILVPTKATIQSATTSNDAATLEQQNMAELLAQFLPASLNNSTSTTTSQSTMPPVEQISAPKTTPGAAIYNSIDKAFGIAISKIRSFLQTPVEKTLYGRITAKLDAIDTYLDKKLPNMWIQKKIDGLGLYRADTTEANPEELIATAALAKKVEKKFSRLQRFDAWVRESADSKENWYMQLATYLVKLPLRSAMNVLNLLYSVIETVLYTAVHPIKSINRLVKMIITMIHEITQPETWTKIGVGTIGMSLGQFAIAACPLSHMALGIGAAMMIAGLSIGALRAAIINENNEVSAVKDNLFNQLKEIPETFLTSFFMGLLLGGVRKVITPRKFANIEEAKKFADEYAKKNNLPPPKNVILHPNGEVIIDWDKWSHNGQADLWLKKYYPKLARKNSYGNTLRISFPKATAAHYPYLRGVEIEVGNYYPRWDRYYKYQSVQSWTSILRFFQH